MPNYPYSKLSRNLTLTIYGFPGFSAATPNRFPKGLTGSFKSPPSGLSNSNNNNNVDAIAMTSFCANRLPVHYISLLMVNLTKLSPPPNGIM